MAAQVVAVFGGLFLVGAALAAFPRQMWELNHIFKGWQYKDPDALQPSDSAIRHYRIYGLVTMVGIICLAEVIVIVALRRDTETACDRDMADLTDKTISADDIRQRAKEMGLSAVSDGTFDHTIDIMQADQIIGQLERTDDPNHPWKPFCFEHPIDVPGF